MATFGVDPVEGFKLKRLNDIQVDMQALLIQVTDPDTGETLEVDFNEDDPLINIMNAFIDALAKGWEQVQLGYNQFDPNLAEGPSLSGLVQLNGLSRKSGTPSEIPITYTGIPGTVIPANQEISDTSSTVVWVTTTDVTLDGSGLAIGFAKSKVNGSYFYATGTVNKILTAVNGWESVFNTSDSTLGKTDEISSALRIRRRNGTLTPAQSIVDSIYSNLLNIDSVSYARVFQNRTLVTDARGIPGKTVAAVVLGGTDQEIAEEILVRVSSGTNTFGNTTVVFQDPFGEGVPIRFVRPEELPVMVEVDVTVIDNLWGTNSSDEIKQAIVSYAQNGAFGIGIDPEAQGFDPLGFPPGDDILLSRLYTPINSVAGHKVTGLRIDYVSGGIPIEQDLTVLWNQLGTFDTANILITVTAP